MNDATEFGKFLRELMARNNLRQEQLAKELGVSPGILSNYIIGKNIPEIDFLEKCVNRFSLEKKELKDLFVKAFFNTVQNQNKITLDIRYFREDRLDTLVHIITILLLYADRQSSPTQDDNHPLLCTLFENIKRSFNAMDKDEYLELLQPTKPEK